MLVEFLARDDGAGPPRHGIRAGCQVWPPSVVSKLFVLRRFQMVACSASVARTPPRSSKSGKEINFQCAPPSVVRRTDPRPPTIQQTVSEGAEPVCKSTYTPLFWRDQEVPLSRENSMAPARPTRQRRLEPGGEIRCGLEIALVTSNAAELLYVDTAPPAAEGREGGGAAGLAVAAFIFFASI